jgi:hypothetical protein
MQKIINIRKILLFTALGLILGVTGALSFLRTSWAGYQIDFFFWWSIISTIFGGIFLVLSIWQYWKSESEKGKNNAQVKVWMQEANGLSQALQRIISDNLAGRYSTPNDVCNSIWALQISAFSLYQSLYEERCVTEEEYKTRQRKIGDLLEKIQVAELETKLIQAERNKDQ